MSSVPSILSCFKIHWGCCQNLLSCCVSKVCYVCVGGVVLKCGECGGVVGGSVQCPDGDGIVAFCCAVECVTGRIALCFVTGVCGTGTGVLLRFVSL